MSTTRRVDQGLLVLLGVALLCAVAAWAIGWGSDEPTTDRDRLLERVESFWQLRLAGDGHAVYDLMEPTIRRDYTQSEYTATQIHNEYFSYDVLDVRIDGDRATVEVEFEWIMKAAALASIRPQTDVLKDEWIRVDGEWYRKYREPHIPGVHRT